MRICLQILGGFCVFRGLRTRVWLMLSSFVLEKSNQGDEARGNEWLFSSLGRKSSNEQELERDKKDENGQRAICLPFDGLST